MKSMRFFVFALFAQLLLTAPLMVASAQTGQKVPDVPVIQPMGKILVAVGTGFGTISSNGYSCEEPSGGGTPFCKCKHTRKDCGDMIGKECVEGTVRCDSRGCICRWKSRVGSGKFGKPKLNSPSRLRRR